RFSAPRPAFARTPSRRRIAQPAAARLPPRASENIDPFSSPCPCSLCDIRGRTRAEAAHSLSPYAKCRRCQATSHRATMISRRYRNLHWFSWLQPGAPRTARLLVEPDVFHAPAVVDAVDHRRQPVDPGLPAGRGDPVENDRPGSVLL